MARISGTEGYAEAAALLIPHWEAIPSTEDHRLVLHLIPSAASRVLDIGDGGCFFQVVDITVRPEHQGRGLGKAIMKEIMAYLDAHAPPTSYVSLIADGPAKDLYAQFGFVPTAPASIGMALKRPAGAI